MKFSIAFVLATLTASIAAQAAPAAPAAGAPAAAPKRKLPCGFSCINVPIQGSKCEAIGAPAAGAAPMPPSAETRKAQRDCVCTIGTFGSIFEADGCVAKACAKANKNPKVLAAAMNKMCSKTDGFKPFATT